MPKKKEEEEQTTLDLDQAMVEGMEKFQGELDEAAGDKTMPETKLEETGPAKEEDKEKGPKETPQAPEHPKEEEPVKEVPLAKEEKPASETPDARFKTHEEAEKGYRHIQAEKTRLEEDLKQERAARAAEKEAREKAAEKQKAFEEAEAGLVDYATERHEQALTEIEELDPEDTAYQKKVARYWAEKDRDIRRYEREHGLMDVAVAPAAAAKTETPSGTGESTVSEQWEYVGTKAKEAGIDFNKDEFFKLVCGTAPTKDGKGTPMTYDEQIDWAITKTKNYHSTLIASKTTEVVDLKAKEHQQRETPMGKSSSDVPSAGKEAGKPVSLDDAVESAKEERRL